MTAQTEIQRMVGILLMTEIFDRNHRERKAALLRERGVYDFLKKQPETRPGTYQVTTFGHVPEGMRSADGLIDVCKRELHSSVERAIEERRKADGNTLDNADRAVPVVFERADAEKEVKIYAMRIEPILVHKTKLSPSSGRLWPITEEEAERIVVFDENDEEINKYGIKDRNIIAMLADEKKAVEMAFRYL